MSNLLLPQGFSPEVLRMLPYGAEDDPSGGYGTEGDIVYTTNDGVDLNALWDEAQQALAVWNQGRGKLVDLLTFNVTNEIETVPQVGEATFELASEFGEPEGERLKIGYFQMGFDFEDYGGTPILGINSNVIIAHGISKAKAIKNMILLSKNVIDAKLSSKIAGAFTKESV